MNQGTLQEKQKYNQQTANQHQLAPAYYSNPKDSNYAYPNSQRNQYPAYENQQPFPPMQMQRQYPAYPIAPNQQVINNQNYFLNKFHWGKFIGFIVIYALDLYVVGNNRANCSSSFTCSSATAFVIIYVLFGLVYLLINLIMGKIRLEGVQPLCMFLFSHQNTSPCQCWLGFFAGLLIIIYCPITLMIFLYHMKRRYCCDRRQPLEAAPASSNNIINNNF